MGKPIASIGGASDDYIRVLDRDYDYRTFSIKQTREMSRQRTAFYDEEITEEEFSDYMTEFLATRLAERQVDKNVAPFTADELEEKLSMKAFQDLLSIYSGNEIPANVIIDKPSSSAKRRGSRR